MPAEYHVRIGRTPRNQEIRWAVKVMHMSTDNNTRKAQYYLIKPIALIMTIIVMFVIFYALQNYRMQTYNDAGVIDSIVDTSAIISILTNSENCIAYNPLELGVYGSIVSVEKLEEFTRKYPDVEPECARNYIRGWHVEIKDLMTGDVWTFGAPDYDKNMANKVLNQRKVSSMPIAIRYSATKVNPARIKVITFSGDLERIAGFFDYACMSGRRSRSSFEDKRTFNIDHPIIYEDGKLCLLLGKDKMCRETYCDMLFDGMKIKGEYQLLAEYRYSSDRLVVKR